MNAKQLLRNAAQRIASLPHTISVSLGLQKPSWYDDEKLLEKYHKKRRGQRQRRKALHRNRRQRGQNPISGKK